MMVFGVIVMWAMLSALFRRSECNIAGFHIGNVYERESLTLEVE